MFNLDVVILAFTLIVVKVARVVCNCATPQAGGTMGRSGSGIFLVESSEHPLLPSLPTAGHKGWAHHKQVIL